MREVASKFKVNVSQNLLDIKLLRILGRAQNKDNATELGRGRTISPRSVQWDGMGGRDRGREGGLMSSCHVWPSFWGGSERARRQFLFH